MAFYLSKKTGEVRETNESLGPRDWIQISSSRAQQLESLAAIQQAKAQYAPGGGFGKGVEAALERGKVRTLASGMQSLVGAGLAGTTLAGGLGKRYEEEVAAPMRASLEERRAQALSGIAVQQAGMGFQAAQSAAERDLQTYLANLQATLQREGMALRGPTVTAPTGGGYAQQFPSIYETAAEPVPDWTGGATTMTAWQRPASWGPELSTEELLASTQYQWA